MVTDNLTPFFKNNNIAICMSSSNEYTVFLSVVIESIIENSSKSNNYDIVVMNTNISQKNKQLLCSLTKNHGNVTVRFIEINEMIKNLTFYTWAHFTQFTYYRLIIPKIFKNYNKIIYLDSDIVVNADIAELYNMDVSKYLFGACRDTHVVARLNCNDPIHNQDYYMNQLFLLDRRSYAQCGVMLINIEKMRRTFPEDFLIKEASCRHYTWLDQDLMNTNCRGMIKFLPNVWNVMVFNTPTKIDEYFLPEDLKKEYFAARENPKIVHYIGRSAPCYDPYGDFNALFWKYARNTPYYEYLLSQMMDVKINKKINSLRRKKK